MEEQKGGYFEAALSDFVFDVAAGGAIRHLTDRGHSVEQIMKELDYPVPRQRVEKAVFRHLVESGTLLARLPVEDGEMKLHLLQTGGEKDKKKFLKVLAEHIEIYGDKNSYMECPFGIWKKDDEKKLQQVIECLTSREREYILGIRWEHHLMYHRLNDRMREIGMKLASGTEEEWRFIFMQ